MELEGKLGYSFRDKKLLETALTHSSYANEKRSLKVESNERLEFLGDSVLGIVAAEYLFRKYPAEHEGKLTKERAALVCEQSLYKTALELGIGEYLRLGHGEELGGGRQRASILADAVEAVIAAMYLDGGFEPAVKFIEKNILSHEQEKPAKDYKTMLQEYVQRGGNAALVYNLTGTKGPDHMKEFFVEVCLDGKSIGAGSGKSKKEAEQGAARMALERMEK